VPYEQPGAGTVPRAGRKETTMKMGTFVRIVLGLLVGYGVYCLLIFFFQRYLIFPRYAIDVPASVADRDDGRETWWIETETERVEAWFFPPAGKGPRSDPAPAVIFAHGNAELIDIWPEELRGFRAMGFGLLLVEYPGYGRSRGAPSQKSVTATFLKAYDRLAARPDVDPRRIVLFGRSLGGGAVCTVATQRPSAALILMSSFTSIRSMSRVYFVPPFIVRDAFDNMAVLGRYQGPVLVIHGRYDDIVSYEHGKALAKAAKGSKLITYECGHNDCPMDWPVFWKDVQDFFVEAKILMASGKR
jgi:pimeloyl-ACP methyl ester carboxylesterase